MLRADSAQYHKLNGDTALQLSSGDDLNLLPNGIAYTTDGGTTSSLLHIPPGITATSAVIITESGNGVPNLNAFRLQTMRIRHNNQIYVRFSGEPLDDGKESWNDWVKIPLCKSPQEFNLPLSDGYTGTNKYFKTQENLVGLYVNLSKSDSSEIENAATFGTLPAGFRPSYNVYVPAVACSTSGAVTDAREVAILPNGSVQAHFKNSGSEYRLRAYVLFVAAS